MTPRIVVEPHAMKGRLNEAPLAGVQRAVARQQPVAEEPPRAAQRSPFDEPMMVGDQHLLDVVGMIQQKHMERAEPEVRRCRRTRRSPATETPTDRAGSREGFREAACHAAQVETRENLTLPRGARRAILAAMIAIVLNPASGLTRRPRLREEVEELFRDAGIDARIRELADPGDISAAVRQALDEHPDAVVAGGGDGTVSAVAVCAGRHADAAGSAAARHAQSLCEGCGHPARSAESRGDASPRAT